MALSAASPPAAGTPSTGRCHRAHGSTGSGSSRRCPVAFFQAEFLERVRPDDGPEYLLDHLAGHPVQPFDSLRTQGAELLFQKESQRGARSFSPPPLLTLLFPRIKNAHFRHLLTLLSADQRSPYLFL